MDNRTRILRLLEGQPVDRMPAVHFGYWDELLAEWAKQGHITEAMAKMHGDGNPVDRKLDKMLGWDCCYSCNSGSLSRLMPGFGHKVLRKEDGGVYYIEDTGVTLFKKDGAMGIPQEVDYLLKDRESYQKYYKKRFAYKKMRNTGSMIMGLRLRTLRRCARIHSVGSAIGDIRNICTVIGLSYLMYDDYDLLKEIVSDYAEMQYKCLETAFRRGIRPDMLHFWEDICFKTGPLISPEIFRELCYPFYKRVSDLAKRYGVKYISVDCDGDITKLAPIWLEAGVNVMFPIEYGTWQGDIAKLRKVAPGILGIGGMDKTVLSKDEAAVDQEIERLRPLVKMGGYVPCPDHRLPAGTKFELVKYYTDKIKKILD